MRGRLAVLIAAALLTLLPVNSPGVSEAAKRCTVAGLNGTCSRPLASAHPQADPVPQRPKPLSKSSVSTVMAPSTRPRSRLTSTGGAPNFDIYFDPSGDSEISLIQTDKGNVFRRDGDEKSALTSDLLTSRRRPQWVARSRGPLADVSRSLADGGGEVLDRGRRGRHGARAITVFMVAAAGWALRIDPCRTL